MPDLELYSIRDGGGPLGVIGGVCFIGAGLLSGGTIHIIAGVVG